MQMFLNHKRIGIRTAAVLTALALLCAAVVAGCSASDDVPNGMQTATAAGATYRLYVPKNWTPKTQSGLSGAYVTLASTSDVSAYQKEVPADTSAEDFWLQCEADYRERWEDYKLLNRSENTVSGKKGIVSVFSLTYAGTLLRCMQVSVVSGTTAYVILYTAADTLYETYIDQIYEIVSVFVIDTEPAPGPSYEILTPADTPEGMVCISGPDVAYYLFIPQTWTRIGNDEVTSAQAPGDKSNVSLTVYLDSTLLSVDRYWEIAQKSFEELEGFSFLSESETQMGGYPGKTYLFETTVSGVTYRISQTVVIKDHIIFGPMAYILTYTSTPELFDSHLSDVESIRTHFLFR